MVLSRHLKVEPKKYPKARSREASKKPKVFTIPFPKIYMTLSQNETILLDSCVIGDIRGVYKQIWNGTNVNCVLPFAGATPLLSACKIGSLGIVAILLNAGSLVVTLDSYSTSALHYASNHNDERILALLLSKGVLNINSKDDYGSTPLHFGATRGRLQVVKLLLQSGASALIRNNNASRPSDVTEDIEIRLLLLIHEAREDKILESSKVVKRKIKKVRRLRSLLY